MHIVEVLCAGCCPGMFRWLEKWCRTVLRNGEMMWYVFPFCPVVGGVKVRWHGLHWGPVRQVSTICEKIYDNG